MTEPMRAALESAQRIIERDYPNGQLAIDIRNALAVGSFDPAQPAVGCGDPSCKDPNCDYGKHDDALRAEVRSLRIDNARLRDEAAIRALAVQVEECPRPVIPDHSAKACVESGNCGCDHNGCSAATEDDPLVRKTTTNPGQGDAGCGAAVVTPWATDDEPGRDFSLGLKSLSGLRTLTPEQSDFLHDAAEEFERLRDDLPQAIDTAPKDGSHILAWRIPIGIRVTNNTHPPTVVHWFNDPEEPGFYTSVNERAPEHPFEATHWSPLPAGPSLSRRSKSGDGQ
jgi:hypothetical protein